MQDEPRYEDVVEDVRAFLAERLEAALAAGVAEERIWLDPGIGFGKTLEHNLELLRRLGELRSLGRPLVVGTSRKSFIGKVDGSDSGERIGGTIASSVLAAAEGAEVLRVHDVAEVAQAVRIMVIGSASAMQLTAPVTPSKATTTPWCRVRPGRAGSLNTLTSLAPKVDSAARSPGMIPHISPSPTGQMVRKGCSRSPVDSAIIALRIASMQPG